MLDFLTDYNNKPDVHVCLGDSVDKLVLEKVGLAVFVVSYASCVVRSGTVRTSLFKRMTR